MELCKIASSVHSLGTRHSALSTRIELEPWLPAIAAIASIVRSRQSAAHASGIPNEAAQLAAVIAVIVNRFGCDLKIKWMDAISLLISLLLPYPVAECTEMGRDQLSSGCRSRSFQVTTMYRYKVTMWRKLVKLKLF